MTTIPRLEVFNLISAIPIYTAPGAFPTMQRLSGTGLAGAAQSEFIAPVPYRLWGLTLDTSLRASSGVIGVCVVANQNANVLAYSDSIRALATHNTISTSVVSRTVFVELDPAGLLIPSQQSIALYAFTPAPMQVTDTIFAAVSLYMSREI